MIGGRFETGGLIDRATPIYFTFDGRRYAGFRGDTIASALLANGVRVVGRSFKYHRPRGVWGSWFDEPNAIFSVTLGDVTMPNMLGTTTLLEPGMSVRAVNAWPSAQNDIKGGLDLFHRFLGAGFYYKTFMAPDWHLFEPMIRRMAGLGVVDASLPGDYVSQQITDRCDLLVVGAGPAGLVAAEAAACAGKSVWLVEDHADLGGSLRRRGDRIEGQSVEDWITARCAAIEAAGGKILTRTTAFGAYDHGLFGLAREHGFGKAPTLYRLRAGACVLAAGAIDRPVTFASNDLPGVHSLEGALDYMGRYGVLLGGDIAIAANHSQVDQAAERMKAVGCRVSVIDPAAGCIAARGRKGVRGIGQNGRHVDCETILASAGWTPVVHLWRHAGGKLVWDDALATFRPAEPPENMRAVGAANGTFGLDQALAEGRAAGAGQAAPDFVSVFSLTPVLPVPGTKGRQWIDFQHDVTLKDVELAARENYVSVEHLKRYTTLGMASDQGKTSNIPGLAAMAAIQGKAIPEVGSTTFRPPFVPMPLELYHGHHRRQSFHPLKRLPLEDRHRAAGAVLGEYGGWLRPAWYGSGSERDEVAREVRMVRATGGLLDASPLGKIEIMGPDAEAFVNFVYYNTMSTLKPGRLRYGFLLTERGVVYDDGVVFRMGPDRFVISSSSSHAEGVTGLLEGWRQDGNDPNRIFVHDTTNHWSTVTITGPSARAVTATLGLDVDLSSDAFPHMSFRETIWQGDPLRIARVSFTGEVSYEMSVRAGRVHELWDTLTRAGAEQNVRPIGLEAISVLRAEKGFIIIGKDTDGETMPHDLGFAVPRLRKSAAFVGDRSLHTDVANDPERRQMVGLAVASGAPMLATGAHIVEGKTPRSIGIVTSSYDTTSIGRPIALALVDRGAGRHGEMVTVWHMGQTTSATIIAPCAFDPKGDRIHA
ncbi:MAG: 2Fe-2S iron-sulfur cluster-binding protein [Qingshengfaniella sp.]